MQLPLPRFNAAPATHIVSLGRDCAVAYNLRRFHDFSMAFPFDWWITPATGLLDVLMRPDAGRLYDPAQLELTPDFGSVRRRETGILLFHEFPRDKSRPGRPVRPDWRDEIGEPKSRTAALLKRFLELNASGNRIAFVRQPPDLADAIASHLAALFPLPEWTLIVLDEIPGAEGSDWQGDPARWDEALNALQLTLDRTRHRPFASAKSAAADRRHDPLSGN